jgi:peroxiredoxin
MKKSQILLMTAVYTIAFGYFGCKKADIPAAETAAVEATVQAGTPGAPAKGYTPGETYFKLPDCKGGAIDLAAFAGKPVMLIFFTENCPYCRKAAPFIERMNREYSTKGLNTIGISLEDSASAAAGFAADFDLTFPLAYDGQETARRYRAQGVPFIYLLTKKHVINRFWAGYHSEFDAPIRKGIEEII